MPPKKAKKPLKRTPIKKKKHVSFQKLEKLQTKHGGEVFPRGSQDCNKNKNKNNKTRKPIQHRRKPSGELAVFKEMAEGIEEAICRCCKKTIGNLGPINFSHVVPKSIAPELRLDKRNIWIVCADCHHLWEFGDRSLPIFEEKRKAFEELKREINNKTDTK